MPQPNIVFFDGVCGLCNRSVNFLLKIDRRQRLTFAPLQGETAAATLDDETIQNLDTIVFWDGKRAHSRSDALLEIARALGGGWKAWTVFRIVPRSWRDALYRFISSRRYAWFGKSDACRLPTPEERDRFLD